MIPVFARNASAVWPPHTSASIETIASSYVEDVPKFRLFNLSPDTKNAGMSMGGEKLASNVRCECPQNLTCLSASSELVPPRDLPELHL